MGIPNLPGAMESMVTAIRAHSAGGSVRMAVDAKSFILVVTAARPATDGFISPEDQPTSPQLFNQYSLNVKDSKL